MEDKDRMVSTKYIICYILLVAGFMINILASNPAAAASKRSYKQVDQNVGAAYISDLSGNVAGNKISGTNVCVRMYVKKSWPNIDHRVTARFGTTPMASTDNHIKVNTVSSAGQPYLRTDSSGNWHDSSNKGWVKFDTTSLLDDGTTGSLNIKLTPAGHSAFCSNGSSDLVIYNKAYVINDPAILNGTETANYVASKCSLMKHSVRRSTSDARDTILGEIYKYTVFYAWNHGGYDPSSPSDPGTYIIGCSGDAQNDIVSQSLVSSFVSAYKGSIFPSFNLVHLDCCYSGAHNDMAKAFGILNNDGGSRADQAYIGWISYAWSFPENRNWTKSVWDQLSAGATVGDAVDFANANHYEPGTCRIYGDRNTTLHSVYCGVVE
jgi:hypothetical protein